MNFAGIRVLLPVAFLGFLGGSGSYFLFNFLLNHMTISPMLEMLIAPWFISGSLGAVLAVTIVLVYAHLSKR